MGRTWVKRVDGFTISWGGRSWFLRPGHERPGLYDEDQASILALAGLAEPGRWEPAALGGSCLTGVDCRFNRVTATYQPPDWAELTVRASWTPQGERGMDLEIELLTRSVGRLRGLEVLTSTCFQDHDSLLAREVDPRDARAAALSYDGREPHVEGILTRPPLLPGTTRDPWIHARPDRAQGSYAEFAHPDDESRLIHGAAGAVRHGFFGYDLERGVVLRGRLRGVWLEGADGDDLARARNELTAFLAEPPPLTM